MVFTLFGCKDLNRDKLLCNKEKVFTSITSFQELQDSSEFKELLATPFNFENINDLKDYFNYKEQVYNKRYDSIGFFPLKIVYKSDTLLLADCNQYFDWTIQNRINIRIENSSMTVDGLNMNITLAKYITCDSLSKSFSNMWSGYFERYAKVKLFVTNRDSIEKIMKRMYENQYACLCYISIENNCSKTDLALCLNIILNSYYKALRKEIKEYYRTEICNLSDIELKNLGHELQLWFIIKEYNE